MGEAIYRPYLKLDTEVYGKLMALAKELGLDGSELVAKMIEFALEHEAELKEFLAKYDSN